VRAEHHHPGQPFEAMGAKPHPEIAISGRDAALVELGKRLKGEGYRFTAITPLSHRRVNNRREAQVGRTLHDIFGWSRPFEDRPELAWATALLAEAGQLEQRGDHLRSAVRFATLGPFLFMHSAFPTDAGDAVFFGPDTYRFARTIRQYMPAERAHLRILDIGCGSGAGGLYALGLARRGELVLTDINESALRYSRINAAINDVGGVTCLNSDLFEQVTGLADLVIANPPYLVDPGARLYRHGGPTGYDLSLRIAEQSLEHIAPGGRLILYTGTPIVAGVDQFRDALTRLLAGKGRGFFYEEVDPDVFGEELETAAYAHADRIAAVVVVMDQSQANS
jgi:methylase of polypeptide subunit release factors